MGALGTLGIGLSVLFGLFLVVLAGEIYYMLCCRRGRLGGGSNSRRVSSVQVVEAQAAAAATEMGGFAREAAMVGSFGGYPANPYQSEFVSKFFPPSSDMECTHISPFDGILFTIAEETKEEMELHAGNVKFSDSPLRPANLTCENKPVVDTLSPTTACSSVVISLTEASACTSSTSLSFSVTPEATPFATPPSSPSASDSSSDTSLPSPSSLATAASRISGQSYSPASASTSPATAASHFSLCSLSPASMTGSPATANSRFSVASPVSITVSPAATRFSAASPASTSPASQRSSVDAPYVYGDRGPLGALFRRSYNSPSRYSPLRPVVWSGQITDFRHALPFSPPNAQFFMNC